MKDISKKKLRAYLIGSIGLFFVITGVVLSKKLLSETIEGVKEKLCVDSPSHKYYKTWVGDASIRPKSYQIKIYYWNITNKNNFLYKREIPKVQEVGPYVYIFGHEKIDVVFTSTTYKYKNIKQIEFDPDATKKECPLCSEHDLLTVINMGYVGAMAKSNGDVKFALGFMPSVVDILLKHADNVTGSRDATLQSLGLLNVNTFPQNYTLFPADWKPDFSLHTNENYTSTEMKALFSVLQNPTFLGVAKPTPTFCKSQPINTTCLQSGFLPLAEALITRQKELIASQSNFTGDQIFMTIFETIRILFCPNVTHKCLDVTKNDMISKVSSYITDHLVKLVIHLLIDTQNSGIITTRKQSELSVGYYMTHLRLPNFPNGLPVPGLIGNDSDREIAKQKKYQEFSKCDVAGLRSQSWISYDGSTSIPSHLFPNANTEFLRIKGRFARISQGHKNSLTMCKLKQLSGVEERYIFNTIYYASIKINRIGKETVNSVHTEAFELDLDHLYGVNNSSTFFTGLFDASNSYQLPVLISAPHFLGGSSDFGVRFSMTPNKGKHLSTYNIEPVTGLTLSSNIRVQFNTYLPKNVISAPRAIPLNISYYNNDDPHTAQPIPVCWTDVKVVSTEENTDKLKIILKMVKGSCASVILGPILGISCVILSIILFLKAVKASTHVESFEEYKS